MDAGKHERGETRNEEGTKRSDDDEPVVRENGEREKKEGDEGEGERERTRRRRDRRRVLTALGVASLTVTTATDCPNDVGSPPVPSPPPSSRSATPDVEVSSYCRDKYKAYFARSPIQHPLVTSPLLPCRPFIRPTWRQIFRKGHNAPLLLLDAKIGAAMLLLKIVSREKDNGLIPK